MQVIRLTSLSIFKSIMSKDSPAMQALNVASAALVDSTTPAAMSSANSVEAIAGAYNDTQDVQNMDAARFTGRTTSEPARAESPTNPDHNPAPPSTETAAEAASEPAPEPPAEPEADPPAEPEPEPSSGDTSGDSGGGDE